MALSLPALAIAMGLGPVGCAELRLWGSESVEDLFRDVRCGGKY